VGESVCEKKRMAGTASPPPLLPLSPPGRRKYEPNGEWEIRIDSTSKVRTRLAIK
jgi:hypothetical protein